MVVESGGVDSDGTYFLSKGQPFVESTEGRREKAGLNTGPMHCISVWALDFH